MQILALCGSIRRQSSNLSLLQALADLCPASVRMVLYDGLRGLPPFDPDEERAWRDGVPPQVKAFRFALQTADAVVISSPEYAHSLPGVLKNALDWVVGSGDLSGKPVAIVTASALSQYIQPVLTEILLAMNARVIKQASGPVPGIGRGMSAGEICISSEAAAFLRDTVSKLMGAVTQENSISCAVQGERVSETSPP